MKRMHPRDAAFFYLETRDAPQTYISGWVFTASEEADARNVRDWLEARIEQIPMFYERIVRVPFDFGYPYVVGAGTLDLDHHIRFHDVGTWKDLQELQADLVQRPMDRTRPLWEIHVALNVLGVKGSPDPSVVIMVKLHHAIADGKLSVQIARRLFAREIEAINDEPLVDGDAPDFEPIPSPARLLIRDILAVPAGIMSWRRGFREMQRDQVSAVEDAKSNQTTVKAPAPLACVNGTVSAGRIFDCVFFELDELKQLKNRIGGVSVNDVLLTIISEGFREYSAGRGEPVALPLRVAVPISLRVHEPQAQSRNQFAVLPVDLHPDVDNLVERTRLIHESVVTERETTTSAALGGQRKSGSLIPSYLARAGFALTRRNQRRSGVIYTNFGASNVPRGAAEDYVLITSESTASFGMTSLDGLVGLAHTIGTLGDSVTLNITADRTRVHDAGAYAGFLQSAYSNLVKDVADFSLSRNLN